MQRNPVPARLLRPTLVAMLLAAGVVGGPAPFATADPIDDGAVGGHGYTTLAYKPDWGDWDEAEDTGCRGPVHFDLIPDGDVWILHMVAAAHCAPDCPRDLADAAIAARWEQFQAERRATGQPDGYLLPPAVAAMCDTQLTEHTYGMRLHGDPAQSLFSRDDYHPWAQGSYRQGRLVLAGLHLFFGTYYVWDAEVVLDAETGRDTALALALPPLVAPAPADPRPTLA